MKGIHDEATLSSKLLEVRRCLYSEYSKNNTKKLVHKTKHARNFKRTIKQSLFFCVPCYSRTSSYDHRILTTHFGIKLMVLLTISGFLCKSVFMSMDDVCGTNFIVNTRQNLLKLHKRKLIKLLVKMADLFVDF